MRIAELTAYVVRLPLRRPIKHASAEREVSENLLVRCRLADGTEGWGEGIPRPYVTGETSDGALEQFAVTPLADQLGHDCTSWDHVLGLCNSFSPPTPEGDSRGCGSNSLRCAVELSVLDAFGQLFGEPLSAAAQRFEPARPILENRDVVCYSAVITAAAPRAEIASAVKMRCYGFADCKLKVGMAGVDEPQRVRRIRRGLGPKMDLRLDANEAWDAATLVRRVEPLLESRISCIEQPVPHEEVECLAEFRRQVKVPVMLDESLTSMADAEESIRRGTCDLFNIRLSKCGGFLNCLRLASLARQANVAYQLGCHPGESGVLSAAGRHWAQAVGDVRYVEGSYDRHVLAMRLTHEDMTFGYGGRAPALRRPGLGVRVDPAALERIKVRERTHRL